MEHDDTMPAEGRNGSGERHHTHTFESHTSGSGYPPGSTALMRWVIGILIAVLAIGVPVIYQMQGTLVGFSDRMARVETKLDMLLSEKENRDKIEVWRKATTP